MIYRNKKLLDFAKFSPCCFACGRFNDGTVVAAHSHQSRDGKGKGIKAHDFRVAYLCHDCHMEIDQGSRLSKAERVEAWEEAHRKTVEWWFLSGILGVKGTR